MDACVHLPEEANQGHEGREGKGREEEKIGRDSAYLDDDEIE